MSDDKLNKFPLVRRPSSAVEKAAPGAKRILSGMIADTLDLATSKEIIVSDEQVENWFQTGENLPAKIYEDLRGLTPEQAKARVYQDSNSRALWIGEGWSDGKNGVETRKLVAMQSPPGHPDGEHIFTGTAYQNYDGKENVRYVTTYDKSANPVGRKFDDLVKEGWKPLATFKIRDFTKDYVKCYSPDMWAKAEESVRQREQARDKN